MCALMFLLGESIPIRIYRLDSLAEYETWKARSVVSILMKKKTE